MANYAQHSVNGFASRGYFAQFSHLYAEKWSILGAVPIPRTGRLPRRILFPGGKPGPNHLKRFQAEAPIPAQSSASAPAPMHGGLSVDRILKHLDASADLKQLKSYRRSIKKFKDVILKPRCPDKYVYKDVSNPETLRKARVHLDCAAMVAFRMAWRNIPKNGLWIYCFVDASPQKRGRELYAASFDVWDLHTNTFDRRLFPQIRIGRNMYTLHGKVTAFLWQVFLMTGPHYSDMRDFCNSIGGICTDMGTEFKIADYRDVLIPFCKSLNIRTPKNAVAQEYLFPYAIATVGWTGVPIPTLRIALANEWPSMIC